MLENIKDMVTSIYNAKKFIAFKDGVSVSLPTGERLTLKITDASLSTPIKYKISKYSYCTKMQGGGYQEIGCGDGDTKLLAFERSIAEAAERILYRALKGSKFGTPTSNGWAAHLDRTRAEHSALMELLERDAVLIHWFCKRPLMQIAPHTFPLWIKEWTKKTLIGARFSELKIFISHLGYVPTISTMLHNSDGYGVISHSASINIERALFKSLAETCRLARIVLTKQYIESSSKLLTHDVFFFSPYEQAVIYAHHIPFPVWIFGNEISWGSATKRWSAHLNQFKKNQIEYSFTEIISEPLSIGYCTSPNVQNLFFGRTTDALKKNILNLGRFKNFNLCGEVNLLPHFVA